MGSKKVLVIGAGIVGSSVIEFLRDRGNSVLVLDRIPVEIPGINYAYGDLRNRELMDQLTRDVDSVYHCAAFVSLRPDAKALLWEVNVQGNKMLIESCKRNGVKRLIYASTQVVVCKLGVPASGVDESYPYSTNPITEFAACRIRSEQDVLASHDESGLQTIVIRIPTTYGPRDRFHIPSHLRVSRRYGAWGIGTAKTICGSVYSENAAHALICAEDALRRGKGGGHAYFVSDHASNYFEMIDDIFDELGVRKKRHWISVSMAGFFVQATMALYEVAGTYIRGEPMLSNEALAVAGQDCWFRTDAIRRDLQWEPIVDYHEAISRTAAWFKKHTPRAWGDEYV